MYIVDRKCSYFIYPYKIRSRLNVFGDSIFSKLKWTAKHMQLSPKMLCDEDGLKIQPICPPDPLTGISWWQGIPPLHSTSQGTRHMTSLLRCSSAHAPSHIVVSNTPIAAVRKELLRNQKDTETFRKAQRR